ncbi:MAG: hypothetical protein CO135_02765 [Candidatus Levybacteria bacterium CG_4_9_14_3_um_filter_35_16]|nr:MAG: hypothetical protein COW87_03795 [Candidatus Levybacteria bacterium CG22_combo_CG10-13_8_21_14_all_35_11]PIY94436.1 MAG: hypothetical protein COY68_02650 [Candidatus Levybacteria bacterium CG_4_10_14_0_8_um_filter_35_23]PJA91184.1 MAG: hypothetical protein CO135_02765 [Candidatus Levybacteria bacterium CG_4_9_14_3_um_filter_35_16]PJC54062.1 MAG: hypothetical protein CO028_04595 [Candidatus Levybacteria bacterium CG_4_9_14_0_2_um_filter_35_21]
MAQVSRYPVHKDVEKRIFEVFKNTISALRDSEDIENFLEEFLSPVEKIMLAKRISIAVLLAKGYSYPSIRQMLRVTPSTISNVSLNLKYSDKGYRKIVEKILRDEKMNEFWQKIETKLTDVPPLKGHDWSYWRKEHEYKKRKNKKPF